MEFPLVASGSTPPSVFTVHTTHTHKYTEKRNTSLSLSAETQMDSDLGFMEQRQCSHSFHKVLKTLRAYPQSFFSTFVKYEFRLGARWKLFTIKPALCGCAIHIFQFKSALQSLTGRSVEIRHTTFETI